MTTHIDRLLATLNTRHPVSPAGVMKASSTRRSQKNEVASGELNFGQRMAVYKNAHPRPKLSRQSPVRTTAKNKSARHEALETAKDMSGPMTRGEAAEKSSSPVARKRAVDTENARQGNAASGPTVNVHVYLPSTRHPEMGE